MTQGISFEGSAVRKAAPGPLGSPGVVPARRGGSAPGRRGVDSGFVLPEANRSHSAARNRSQASRRQVGANLRAIEGGATKQRVAHRTSRLVVALVATAVICGCLIVTLYAVVSQKQQHLILQEQDLRNTTAKANEVLSQVEELEAPARISEAADQAGLVEPKEVKIVRVGGRASNASK